MGNLLQKMVGKAVMAVLGFVFWLGYITMCDGGLEGSYTEVAELPRVVFGGGGGTIELEIDLNQAAELSAAFERWDEDDAYEELSSSQTVSPGIHSFSVDVSDATYGYFALSMPDAEVGAQIDWTVSLDGEELESEEVELDDSLPEGSGLYVYFEFDEVAELRQYAQR